MPLYGERSAIFRWETTYSTEQAVLEWSVDEGRSWQLISDQVDLSQTLYQRKASDVFTPALARMSIGNKEYVSDTFAISWPLRVSVGFNCTDSVMLRWEKQEKAVSYKLYAMGEQYLEEVFHSSDTFFVLKRMPFRSACLP